jgi:hypothetical protein
MREEFYANPNLIADSIGSMRNELDNMIKKYNNFRPHHSLHGLTPSEYTSSVLNNLCQSQML